MKKGTVVFIGGGDSFDTDEAFYDFLRTAEYDPFPEPVKKWREAVAESVAGKYDWIEPLMPNKMNADYEAWKIWFEKIWPHVLEGRLLLMGYSLGGGFLLRFLSENTAPRAVDQLILVSACVDETDCPGVGSFVSDTGQYQKIADQVEDIDIFHAQDDDIVPYSHAERIMATLPKAILHTFETDGHFFNREDFPEITKTIIK